MEQERLPNIIKIILKYLDFQDEYNPENERKFWQLGNKHQESSHMTEPTNDMKVLGY